MKIEIGGGFLAILTIIFVIAKLWGVVDWSWWLVFLPIFISLGIFILIISVILILAIVAVICGLR